MLNHLRKSNKVAIGQAVGVHLDKRNFLLTKDLVISFDGLKFTIKKGYITDGASIPPIFEPIVGNRFQGEVLSCAVFHDILYETELYSRHCADNNFKYLMRKNGVSWLKRNLFWLAVRLFGGSVQKRHTVGSVENARQYLQIKRIVL
jgi:hypothetical protein